MRCQQCDKPATFHITELTETEPQELHLCEDHAKEYLAPAQSPEFETPSVSALSAQLKVGQTTEELSRLDKRACPVCGITFYEFRSQGRLGCPHDYECFADELEPLMVNIHGETDHKGKRPKNLCQASSTEMIKLRRQMASELRDKLKQMEKGV